MGVPYPTDTGQTDQLRIICALIPGRAQSPHARHGVDSIPGLKVLAQSPIGTLVGAHGGTGIPTSAQRGTGGHPKARKQPGQHRRVPGTRGR